MSSVVYADIFAPDYSVTGIRQDAGEGLPVVITGSYQPEGSKQPMTLLYRGPLVPTDSSGYAYPVPNIPGQTVTSSVFYGPNTAFFDPDISAGNVRAVGSCKYEETGAIDHGMIYQGPFDGSGPWTPLDVPDEAAGAEVSSTLAHSTMGDIVVGNYDLADKPGSGNGFVYNIRTRRFTVLDIGPFATAYGVWRNGDPMSTSYTICGGYDDGKGINQAFLLDFDSATGAFGAPSAFSYQNDPAFMTHFEGITGAPDGYFMAAQWQRGPKETGAAFAAMVRDPNGAWSAQWAAIDNPNAGDRLCTGNSVLQNNLIGVYQLESGGFQSYVATVSIP